MSMNLGATSTFDLASYSAGYRKGMADGHAAGSDVGAYAVKDCLLKHLDAWGADLRLGLHDVATPEDAWKEIYLLVRDYDPPQATPTGRREVCNGE